MRTSVAPSDTNARATRSSSPPSQDRIIRQPDVIVFGHAIDAAEVAAVGHRQAQRAERAADACPRRMGGASKETFSAARTLAREHSFAGSSSISAAIAEKSSVSRSDPSGLTVDVARACLRASSRSSSRRAMLAALSGSQRISTRGTRSTRKATWRSALDASVAKPFRSCGGRDPISDLARRRALPSVEPRASEDLALGLVEDAVDEVLTEVEHPAELPQALGLCVYRLGSLRPRHVPLERGEARVDGRLEERRVSGLQHRMTRRGVSMRYAGPKLGKLR